MVHLALFARSTAGALLRCLAGLLFVLWFALTTRAQSVAVVVDGPVPAPAQHGLAKLEGSDIQLFENLRDAATRLLSAADTPMVRAAVDLARRANGY